MKIKPEGRADMRDYKSYRHQREPKREPLYVSPKGPWMKDGGINRNPHNPFKPPQGDDE